MTPTTIKQIIKEKDNKIRRCNETIKNLKEIIKDYDFSFSLRWKADMRAIKKWQKKHGKELTWPDHTDLCMWLMEQLDECRCKRK